MSIDHLRQMEDRLTELRAQERERSREYDHPTDESAYEVAEKLERHLTMAQLEIEQEKLEALQAIAENIIEVLDEFRLFAKTTRK